MCLNGVRANARHEGNDFNWEVLLLPQAPFRGYKE